MRNLLETRIKNLHFRISVIYLSSLVFFLAVSIVANYVIREQVAMQVSTLIRRMIKTSDSRELMYTLGSANLTHFDGVAILTAEKNRLFSVPANIDPNEFREDILFNTLKNSYLPVDIYTDDKQTHKMGTILFVFNRFSYFPIAFFSWLILGLIAVPAIRTYKRKMLSLFREQLEVQKAVSKAEIAKKARHDIRSPVAALQTFVGKSDLSFKDQKNLSLTINRIQDIISDLEDSKEEEDLSVDSAQFVIEELGLLIKEVIDEKKLFLSSNCSLAFISDKKQKFFARILRSDVKRIVSNLIDNATQAISESGEVKVVLTSTDSNHTVSIEDNGCGIEESILSQVGRKGFSYGKKNGSGLGVYYASRTAKSHQGTFELTSKVKIGTKAIFTIPGTSAPSWYTDIIEFKKGSTVLILDDQPINFHSWEILLQPWLDKSDLKIKTFSSPDEYKQWFFSNQNENTYSIVDYDLGKNVDNGLYLISLLNLQQKSVLVTGHFDHPDIQDGCENIGCKLLAKGRFPKIQIS